MNIVIAGESPFVEEVAAICRTGEHNVTTFLVEDFLGAMESGNTIPNLTDIDVAIEMHTESRDVKYELLMVMADVVPMNALFLTSVLNVSATEAASWIPNSGRVVGFGVLPPLPENGIVELAAGMDTNIITMERATEFWTSLGQQTITVADGPGLVRARTVCCIINEAATAMMEGVAAPADIDKAMRLGTNYPYGPLEWADHLGIDTVLGVMSGLYEEWGEDRYRPSPLLKRMVAAKRLGKKTGRGFYNYS